ncbi:hypothetical protein GQ54DRAFT_209945 [Martensiomyces pterosporus]|nr:hypothetical protein GQ54DRAFT_209945 [Martensiomyces pterosporus]
MEPHQTPLSTYATELLHSYSRLIVYSGDQDVEMKDAEEAAEVVVDASNFADGNSNSLETAAESTSLIIPAETNADTANPADDGGETTTENAADPVPLPSSSEAPPTVETTAETAMAAAPPAEIEEAAVGDSVPSVAGASSDTPVQSATTDYDVISVDDGTNNDPIEVDTSSDVDNDEDMEKMFQ